MTVARVIAVVIAGCVSVLCSTRVTAQVTDSSRSGAVQGIVYDSIGGAPLAGAVVQIALAEDRTHVQSATADSAGRFRVNDLRAGAYFIGFFHPMLDSLGLDTPVRRVSVSSGQSV